MLGAPRPELQTRIRKFLPARFTSKLHFGARRAEALASVDRVPFGGSPRRVLLGCRMGLELSTTGAVCPTALSAEHEDAVAMSPNRRCQSAAPQRSRRRGHAAAVAGVLLLCAQGTAGAAPRAELWERWTAHVPSSTRTVDHSTWDAIVSRYLRTDASGVNRFAYSTVTTEDRAAIDTYLKTLSGTRISHHRRAEQLAYWVNLYNALTVRVVLEHYPVESIRDIRISPGLFSSGPWGKDLIRVEGESLSLDDIEHRILRPIWRDPRIHYAVNCASVGCPNLMNEAFTAENAERLLDRGARAYINHPRGVRVEGNALVVSSLYEWFKEDFGGHDRGVIEHLRSYASPDLATALDDIQRIADDAYDWALNDLAGG
jgi:hypothetical protein